MNWVGRSDSQIKMKPDAAIEVRFLLPEEGGRRGGIIGKQYGCSLLVDGSAFDCRFLMNDGFHFQLGRKYSIGVKFLNPSIALKFMEKGKKSHFGRGVIAEGFVQ